MIVSPEAYRAARGVEILRAARGRIADEAAWTTGEFARAEDGEAVEAGEPEAVRWCALGAVIAEGGDNTEIELLHEAAGRLWPPQPGGRSASADLVNDSHVHADVLRMFDDAIAHEGGADAR